MARRTRRRPKVVWLPLDLSNRVGQQGTAINGGVTGIGTFVIDVSGPFGATTTAVIPVVRDDPQPAAFLAASLSDMENSSYRLRRIVGKIWWGWQQDTQPQPGEPSSGIITTGFIVLRVKPDGTPIDHSDLNDYGTQQLNNIQDPWIWRRSWFLSDFAQQVLPSHGLGYAPPEGNYLCGSVLDGPHIDQKTARVVGPEERLFMVSTVTCTDVASTDLIGSQAQCFFDLRVLASMRNSVGNRGNSSR